MAILTIFLVRDVLSRWLSLSDINWLSEDGKYHTVWNRKSSRKYVRIVFFTMALQYICQDLDGY